MLPQSAKQRNRTRRSRRTCTFPTCVAARSASGNWRQWTGRSSEWSIGPDEPAGKRRLQVVVEGDIAATFEFEVK